MSYLHGWAVAEIESLSKVFKPPVEMQEKWDKAHSSYVESVAWGQADAIYVKRGIHHGCPSILLCAFLKIIIKSN